MAELEGATAKRTRRIDEIGEESRRRILDAAESLFVEKGFDRTSFVDIAERSGISRGSIPWHFQNKDGLLIAVVERAIDRYMPQTGSVSLDAKGFRDVLAHVSEMMHDPGNSLLYMICTEALVTTGTVHEHYQEFFRARRRGIAEFLAASLRSRGRQSSRSTGAIAAVVNGALLGLQLQWQLDPEHVDLDEGMAALATLVERGVGLPAVAPAPARRRRNGRSGRSVKP